jgi:hypothetical protein
VEQQPRVAHGACQHKIDAKWFPDHRGRPRCAHHGGAPGLEADQPAAGRGHTDRAGPVARMSEWHRPGRHQGRGSPAGAARAAGEIPGVACGTVAHGLRGEVEAPLGCGCLAESDQSGVAEPRHQRVVSCGAGAPDAAAAECELHPAGERFTVLHEERNARERPVRIGIQRGFERRAGEGVEVGVGPREGTPRPRGGQRRAADSTSAGDTSPATRSSRSPVASRAVYSSGSSGYSSGRRATLRRVIRRARGPAGRATRGTRAPPVQTPPRRRQTSARPHPRR